MSLLHDILDEQDQRDLHEEQTPSARLNHLGLSGRPVAEVFAALSAHPRAAVRSGHVGNWEEIWQGQVGLVDYNRYICRDLQLGVPVIHAHTFTESADLSSGDTIYLPAGRIRRRSYERLSLKVKQGDNFVPVPPDTSVCCAFAYEQTDAGVLPLVQSRARELSQVPGATTIPTRLIEDEDLLRRALGRLVDDALDQPSGLTLEHVFGSSVDRQGRRGAAPSQTDDGFDVNGTTYSSPEALVGAAIEALRFGSLTPGDVHDRSAPQDDYLPLLGATTVLALIGYLDYRQPGADNIHAHWGAVSMSGYPPVAGGYFGRRANRRTLRNIGTSLSTMAEFGAPLRFALLPAPILSLLPPREFTSDCELVVELVSTVLDKTERPKADPSGAVDQITSVAAEWIGRHHTRLTPYYLNRFGLARSVFNGTAQVPVDGSPFDPSVLDDLTMQQASILVGALIGAATEIPVADS